jgi:hypothetical protein
MNKDKTYIEIRKGRETKMHKTKDELLIIGRDQYQKWQHSKPKNLEDDFG